MSRIRESGKSAEFQPPGGVRSVARERVPAWRRIEVWRERQALKRALEDIGVEDPDYDETIFLQDPAHRDRYFTRDEEDDPEPESSGNGNWGDESS